ncbi:MAG: heavy-metal-associated domain-containing protein [Dysgonamonadaceae bacterium]|nr:heavy-metal-associated domain-containing protein [Dysgonamonadaceae bacterium]
MNVLVLLFAFIASSSVYSSDNSVTFRVENMTCGGCSGKIKKTVTAIDGVSRFEANLEKRVVTITYDDRKVNSGQLKEAIVAIRYNATDYDPDEVIARKISFKADQIGCGGCAAKVKKNIGAEAGIISVEVDLPTKEVKVEYDANKIASKEIQKDFQKFNYTVVRYWTSEKVKYAILKVEQINDPAEVENNLATEKGILDVSVNEKTKDVAIAYNATIITEDNLADSIEKYNLNLVAEN